MSPPKQGNRKKIRKVEHLYLFEHRYFIFCEGKRTEPNYFGGFKKAIESNPMYNNMVFIDVEGVGKETLKVLEAAEKKVADEKLKDAHIWCIYDKDSFPPERFNQVSEKIRDLNNSHAGRNGVIYHAGWSNQCFEYWFILHFVFYDAKNYRTDYYNFLDIKFKEHGFTNYSKTIDEIFDFLSYKGDPIQAIKWAKKRLCDCSGCTDAESVPATRVHELVEELAKYLPGELRNRYLKESTSIYPVDKNVIETGDSTDDI